MRRNASQSLCDSKMDGFQQSAVGADHKISDRRFGRGVIASVNVLVWMLVSGMVG